jgi:transposase
VVERTLGWLLSYKRLAPRYDRTAVTITAWPGSRSSSSALAYYRRTNDL